MGGVCVQAEGEGVYLLAQILHHMLLLGCNFPIAVMLLQINVRKSEMCSEAPLTSPHLCLQVFTPHRHIKHLFISASGFYRN